MKVAILMPRATKRGGAEQMLDLFLRHAQSFPLECTVIFLEEGPFAERVRNMGIEVQILQAGRLREIQRFASTIYKLRELLTQKNIDLVFSWMSKAHLYGGWAALWAGIPSLWYQLDIPAPTDMLTRLITAVPARKVLACSNQAAEAQRRLWPQRTVKTVYPGVDLSDFAPSSLPSPSNARKQVGLPPDAPVVGIVGRLQRWKGIHVFVDAFSQVLQTHPETYAVIVGGEHKLEPGYADYVENRIDKLGLQDNVTLAGYQSNVPLWMQAMDVVVHTSAQEPFGIVVIEAMALGKPVVAGDSGGPQEIITEGKNGLLASYGDDEGLARQIRRFLDDPDFASAAGTAARERAEDFRLEQYAGRLVQTLSEVAFNESPAVSS